MTISDGNALSAIAYNQGSDARLLGLPVRDNPYVQSAQCKAAGRWRQGWLCVHEQWAICAKKGWVHRVLRDVKR